MDRRRRTSWLAGLLVGLSLTPSAAVAVDEGARAVPEPRPPRSVGGGTLRDEGRVAALIEGLDAARRSGDALPVYALDLLLRQAVERELDPDAAVPSRQRPVHVQNAERDAAGEEEGRRDEAYRTPVSSWVDPRDAPPPGPRRVATKRAPVDEADFERRLRAVVHELSLLDGVLDEPGLNARRNLLVELLQVARDREQARATAGD